MPKSFTSDYLKEALTALLVDERRKCATYTDIAAIDRATGAACQLDQILLDLVELEQEEFDSDQLKQELDVRTRAVYANLPLTNFMAGKLNVLADLHQRLAWELNGTDESH